MVRATSRDKMWLPKYIDISLSVSNSLRLGYRANYTSRAVANICSMSGTKVQMKALGPCP